MTKIFKISLILIGVWFAVPYFYRSYLDYQVFRKIEKEYCEKDAGLMVYVDRINFSQPIVLRYKDISPDTDFTINSCCESSQEIRGISLDIQKSLKKEKIYIQFDNTFGFWPGNSVNIYRNKLDVVRKNYSLDGVPITSTVFVSTLSAKCLQTNTCTFKDLKLDYAKLPSNSLKIEYLAWPKEKIIFHDFVVSEQKVEAFDTKNNQILILQLIVAVNPLRK